MSIHRAVAVLIITFVLTTSGKNPVGTGIGDVAPDIELPNPKGKMIRLSSLHGKIVLVDFWASWCHPCRNENPNVVSAYHKYSKAKFKNARGFTIFSVSLDKNRKRWKKAIEEDGLVWKYHVSDLKGWSSGAAKAYGVMGIPTNFLINADGVIIAKGLRGQALHEAIDNEVAELR